MFTVSAKKCDEINWTDIECFDSFEDAESFALSLDLQNHYNGNDYVSIRIKCPDESLYRFV